MLVVPGLNQFGNVLHVAVGPETEFFLDLNGAAIVDVSEFLNKFNKDHPVYICLTRSKSEAMTQTNLAGCGGVFKSSFGASQGVSSDCSNSEDKSEPKLQPASIGPMTGLTTVQESPTTSGAGRVTMAGSGKCEYCGKSGVALLPLKGIKICLDCTHIELGLKRAKKKAEPDKPGNTK